MKISRFYQQSKMIIGGELELSSTNHRHAVQVLRLKLEQTLILFNGEGGEYQAKLVDSNKRSSRVLLESFDPINRESHLSTTLVLAMIKPEKMDYAIQKSVELGVSTIQPIYTKRSVINIKANRLDKKMHHWHGIIIAACEQSGRTKLPELREPLKFESFLDSNISADQKTACIAMLPGNHPKIHKLKHRENLSLLIGPEGGFTDDEEIAMLQKGISPISFGPRILRAETAVVAGLTACQQLWGDL